MNENEEWFLTHGEAWKRYAALVEDEGLRAQVTASDTGVGWIVRYWTRKEEQKAV